MSDGAPVQESTDEGMRPCEGWTRMAEELFSPCVQRRQRDEAEYRRDRAWLISSVHELPAGVLWGSHGATAAQCAELMEGLDTFAQLCNRLDLSDHTEFIEACRWHFERYAHYLGRRRHFADYATYVRDRHGPPTVSTPPLPPWARR